MKEITGMEWLKKHIGKLVLTNTKHEREIKVMQSINPAIINEFQAWTPLKLVLLNYALDTCTTIIRRQTHFQKMAYFDLFSGSGINKISGTGDLLIGSPLIASLNYSNYYGAMYFIEDDPGLSTTLQQRLSSLNKPSIIVNSGPYGQHLQDLCNIANQPHTYSFFFIDPYSFEFGWDSMRKVLSNPTGTGRDILFTLMSSQIRRSIGLAVKGEGGGTSLNKLYGDDSWKDVSSDEEVAEAYIRGVEKTFSEKVTRTIKVQSAKYHFCYHLLFITNKTRGQNPWLKSIDKAKEEIERNSDKSVELAMDLINKRQLELKGF